MANKEIETLLDSADADLDMAERGLVGKPNPLVPEHLYHAAEKILKAVRKHRGLEVTKEHNLTLLINGNPIPNQEPRPLPANDLWRGKFNPLAIPLYAYATTYRYTLKNPPPIAQQQAWLTTLKAFLVDARSELLTP